MFKGCFALILLLQVCETYPRDLYVPITASKPIIVGSSKFRSKGRFPVLTYFYQEKKVPQCPHWTVLVPSSTRYWKVHLITWMCFLYIIIEATLTFGQIIQKSTHFRFKYK